MIFHDQKYHEKQINYLDERKLL